MGEVGIAAVLVLVALAFLALMPVARTGARAAGVAARERTIARTGKDPADNLVNNAVNGWGERHPVAAKVAPVVFMALVVVAVFWLDA